MIKKIIALTALTCTMAVSGSAVAADKFTLAWSHYTGWEPWAYASDKGIVDKWAQKYGIEIDVVLINDYIESINLYTTGQYDAVTMTNMDALTIPSVGGIDTTAIIVGDYSNGNDGIAIKGGDSVEDLKGRDVMLVELSVSHYLLARALDTVGMSEDDITVVNTSDADIAASFVVTPNAAVVTWNPPLQQVRNAKGTKLVFDSSNIPGEIIDATFVRSDADERFKKALTGAWYETMAIMSQGGPQQKEAIEYMADFSGATTAEFKAQLKTTAMYYDAADAVEFTNSSDFVNAMDMVRNFSFDKGLFGPASTSPDFIGIEHGNGKVLGNKNNIKLRFDTTYMEMANKGTL
jgi:NitT/TauT family transport system substrate-binding protein